ncbi:FAD-dependent oxidoreductase [Streptomyces odonnellii]|uniref:FAD-dependent oxidoreductase n=1 Tax=Streptomyces odonnellii TaxID=1417980 RepID=UPI000AE28EB9|nr:monooxygenase [Streptomyces odonnellii]
MVNTADAETDRTRAEGPYRSPEGRTRHAVVVGGSVAALLTAHVLSAHADRVTVVERDLLPEGPVPRAGVPQSRHTHVLLEGGQRALDELLPGIVAELREYGAPRVGLPSDIVQWQAWRYYRRTGATAHLLTGTRPLLEWLVRRRVLAEPRITVLEGTEVVGLLGDSARVRGVRLRRRGSETHQDVRQLAADLVVDASGRGSRAPDWLAAIGAEPPHEETLDTGLAYATRVYRHGDTTGSADTGPTDTAPAHASPADTDTGTGTAHTVHTTDSSADTSDAGSGVTDSDKDSDTGGPVAGGDDTGATDSVGYYFVPGRGQARGGVALPVEGGRHLVTLSGLRGSEPPSDEAAFIDFAAQLPHPVLHEWLLKARPESPVHAFRATANVRRRYDRPGRRPAGFLAVGDALCAFNPVYGQGLAVAALGAVALRDALADPRRTPTTRRVQRALLRASRQAWDIASGADKEPPGARGDAARTRAVDRPAAWYLARVVRRAPGDPVVGAAFRSATSLVSPVSVLFAPRIVRAVLFGPVLPAPTEPPLRKESAAG